MRNTCLVLLAISLYLISADRVPKLWAVLVAGSNEWWNYRHQADICHAYQILKNHGVPDERIIVMMYDDIAHNAKNKWNGTIINHPKGKDVYHGVPKDYTGKHVNPKNFINVLLGKRELMRSVGSGKVLQSGPDDHVFVNFVDHGSHGMIAFPDSELTVGELTKVLHEMHANKKYGKMLIYLEACESGSMFHGHLPENAQIYATTAANGHESSYACFFDPILSTYLGDCYSVHWMEDSDRENLNEETVESQFKLVRNKTRTSHVKAFGDHAVARLPLAEFLGKAKSAQRVTRYSMANGGPSDPVPSRDVPLEILRRRMDANDAVGGDLLADYQYIQKKRDFFDKFFGEMILRITSDHLDVDPNMIMRRRAVGITQLECHSNLVHSFSTFCYNLGKNPYALKYGYVFVNLCEQRLPMKDVLSKMLAFCSTQRRLYQKIL